MLQKEDHVAPNILVDVAAADIPAAATKTKEDGSKKCKTFMNLPKTENYCCAVDVINGGWYHYNKCDKKVMGRANKNRAFHHDRWNDHKHTAQHRKSVGLQNKMKEIELAEASATGKLTEMEKRLMIQNRIT